MEKYIDSSGLILGIVGLLVCALSGVIRLAGSFYFMGFETNTLFQAGTTFMIAACVLKLQAMSMGRTRSTI